MNLQVQLSTVNRRLLMTQLICYVAILMVGSLNKIKFAVTCSVCSIHSLSFFAALKPTTKCGNAILLYKVGVGVCILIALTSFFTLIVVLIILCSCVYQKRIQRGENSFTVVTMLHGMLIKREVSSCCCLFINVMIQIGLKEWCGKGDCCPL